MKTYTPNLSKKEEQKAARFLKAVLLPQISGHALAKMAGFKNVRKFTAMQHYGSLLSKQEIFALENIFNSLIESLSKTKDIDSLRKALNFKFLVRKEIFSTLSHSQYNMLTRALKDGSLSKQLTEKCLNNIQKLHITLKNTLNEKEK